MYVYPAMRKHLENGDEAVQHDVAEHKELEPTMKELEGVDAGSPQFVGLIVQLEDILRDHVSDEENEQFPELRAKIPRAELVEMAKKVNVAKEVAPTRPHPAARTTRSSTSSSAPGSAWSTGCATPSASARRSRSGPGVRHPKHPALRRAASA